MVNKKPTLKNRLGKAIEDIGNKEIEYTNLPQDSVDVSPFIDNVVNLGLTALTPKTPAPILDRSRRIQTDINYDPQQQSITEGARASSEFIRRNLSDANTAAIMNQSVNNNATRQRNIIASEEANKENELKNQQSVLNMQTEATNNQKLAGFLENDANRSVGILKNLSQNVSEFSKDLTNQNNLNKANDFSKLQMKYKMLEQTEPEVMQRALTLDPDSWADVIVPNYDKLTSADSPYSDSFKKTIMTMYGEGSKYRKKFSINSLLGK